MKKTLLLFLVVIQIFMLSGCFKTEVTENPATAPAADTETKSEEKIADKDIENFFATYVNTDERPYMVMVDNDNDQARPQAGLDKAYILYEMVVEGGATRFLGVFKGEKVEKIGPVRSSRHYFLDYVLEHDGIYVHYGWSPKAMEDIPALGINKINGVLGEDIDIFWRENKFKGDWHSAFTSSEKIKNKASNKGFALTTSKENGLKYSKEYINLPAENKGEKITLKYAGHYKTEYKYNEKTGLYEKSINGKAHKMQNKQVLAFKNVIVELIPDTDLGDGSARRNINTTGTGKAYYFTNGRYEEVTRSKSSRSGVTTYKKADGTELYINPGTTMINIISPSASITIK